MWPLKCSQGFNYLLEGLTFPFSFNRELVPVYSAFHTQLNLHVWFNHTLWNEMRVTFRSVTLEIWNKSSLFPTLTMMANVKKGICLMQFLLFSFCSLPNHRGEWDLGSKRCFIKSECHTQNPLEPIKNKKRKNICDKVDMMYVIDLISLASICQGYFKVKLKRRLL